MGCIIFLLFEANFDLGTTQQWNKMFATVSIAIVIVVWRMILVVISVGSCSEINVFCG